AHGRNWSDRRSTGRELLESCRRDSNDGNAWIRQTALVHANLAGQLADSQCRQAAAVREKYSYLGGHSDPDEPPHDQVAFNGSCRPAWPAPVPGQADQKRRFFRRTSLPAKKGFDRARLRWSSAVGQSHRSLAPPDGRVMGPRKESLRRRPASSPRFPVAPTEAASPGLLPQAPAKFRAPPSDSWRNRRTYHLATPGLRVRHDASSELEDHPLPASSIPANLPSVAKRNKSTFRRETNSGTRCETRLPSKSVARHRAGSW